MIDKKEFNSIINKTLNEPYTEQFKIGDDQWEYEDFIFDNRANVLLASAFGIIHDNRPWVLLEWCYRGLNSVKKNTLNKQEAFAQSEGAAKLFWHVAAQHKLIDITTTIPGKLTEKGKSVLKELEEYFPDFYKNYTK